jgi:hypothetical protein
LVNQ